MQSLIILAPSFFFPFNHKRLRLSENFVLALKLVTLFVLYAFCLGTFFAPINMCRIILGFQQKPFLETRVFSVLTPCKLKRLLRRFGRGLRFCYCKTSVSSFLSITQIAHNSYNFPTSTTNFLLPITSIATLT
jgi:hypothetical protein